MQLFGRFGIFSSPLVGEGAAQRRCAAGEGASPPLVGRAARCCAPGGGIFSSTPPRGLPLTASAKTRSRALPQGESEKSAACIASLRRADRFYYLPLVGRSARSARRVGSVALEAASALNPSPLVGEGARARATCLREAGASLRRRQGAGEGFLLLSSSAKADDPVTPDGSCFAGRCLLDARMRGHDRLVCGGIVFKAAPLRSPLARR